MEMRREGMKLRAAMLILCVEISFFISMWAVPFAVEPEVVGRDIQVFILDIDDSPSSWVGDASAVKAGIDAAISDAKARTKVIFAGENIYNSFVVDSFSTLEELFKTPPERAIFINTHGEIVPMPSKYFAPYVKILKPVEGESYEGGVTVVAQVKTIDGIELDGCPEAYCGFYYHPCYWGPYPMSLVNPAEGKYKVYVPIRGTGTYRITVRAKTKHGLATSAYVDVYNEYYQWEAGVRDRPPLLRCPYVCGWNGSYLEVENNILLADRSVEDYLLLEKPLVNVDGSYRIRLCESGIKRNFLDRVGLIAVDHFENVNVGVDSSGGIFTYMHPQVPSSVLLCGNKDVSLVVGEEDDKGYVFDDGTWLDVWFDDLNASLSAKLILRMRSDESCKVKVEYLGAHGWETVAIEEPRVFWSTHIINMSGLLRDFMDKCRMRLVFSGSCDLDFIGLDTSRKAEVIVHKGELISVKDSRGVNATFGNLLQADGVCAMLEHHYTIDLYFCLPPRNGSLVRDFIFYTKGYYEEGGMYVLDGGKPEAMNVDWEDWFDLIEDRCRHKGWIWANIAGYSFYYFGNDAYWNFMGEDYDPVVDNRQPRTWGLKQFLSRDVTCLFHDGHSARRGYHFSSRMAFDTSSGAYDNLPDNIEASRPLANMDLLWNVIGYVDKDDPAEPHVTASITMNGTKPGVFIHSGLASEADDWTKGYIAAALAIEEARAYLMEPVTLTQEVGNTHAATFSVSMLPGGWGEGADYFDGEYQHYRYVELMLTLPTHFKDYIYTPPEGWPVYWELSVADFELYSSDSDIWAKIQLGKSGWETGNQSKEFMDDIGWWTVGLATDTLSSCLGIPYLGSLVGLIPILCRDPETPETPRLWGQLDQGVWVNGTVVDPNDDEWGTVTIYVKVMFIKKETPRDYTFNVKMVSWLKNFIFEELPCIRHTGIVFTHQLTFTVLG